MLSPKEGWEEPCFPWSFKASDDDTELAASVLECLHIGHRTEVFRCQGRSNEKDDANTEHGYPFYICAVKLLHKVTAKQEAKALKELLDHEQISQRPHPNIVRLMGEARARKDNDSEWSEDCWPWVCLVLEYMPSSLDKFLAQKRAAFMPSSPAEIRVILWQVLRGLNFLHKLDMCHGDVCPGNILLDENTYMVKLCDFGHVQRWVGLGDAKWWAGQGLCDEYIGTPGYTAPEILKGMRAYGVKVDTWSVGCILAELLSDLDRPFFVKADLSVPASPIHQLQTIAEVLGLNCCLEKTPLRELEKESVDWRKLFGVHLSQADQNFLSKLLVCNPENRIDAFAALTSGYFADLLKKRVKLPSERWPLHMLDFVPEERDLRDFEGLDLGESGTEDRGSPSLCGAGPEESFALPPLLQQSLADRRKTRGLHKNELPDTHIKSVVELVRMEPRKVEDGGRKGKRDKVS